MGTTSVAKKPPKGTYNYLEDPDYQSLFPKKRRFIDEYLLDPTSIKGAARRAGYPSQVQANQLHSEPIIQAVLSRAFTARAEANLVTKERIVNELAILSFSDISNFVIDPLTGSVQVKEGVPEYALRCIQSVKVKSTTKTDEDGNTYTSTETEVRLWSKPTALRMLGEHLGLFLETDPNKPNQDRKTQVWRFGDRDIEI